MKKNVLVLLLGALFFYLPLSAQDFIFEEVPNPENHEFATSVGQLDGIQYLMYYDQNFNQKLFAYDGENLSPLDGPGDLEFNYFIAQDDDVLYLSFYDLVTFGQVLVAFDGETFTQMTEPLVNSGVGTFQFNLNGFPFFDFFDFFFFNQTLNYFDGTEMIEVALPDNYTFGFTLGVLNENAFIILYDQFFNSVLFRFDGNVFQEVDLPVGSQWPFQLAQTDDLLYVGLTDANFFNTMYAFDGVNWELIPNPINYQLGGFIGELDGELYFYYYDQFFNSNFFRLDAGTELLPYMNPPGMTYSWTTGTTENYFYMSYYDVSFFNTLVTFNEMEGLNVVPNPTNYNYSNFETEWEDGALLTYYDQSFNIQLEYYNNTDLIEVPLPEPNLIFGDYVFSMNGAAYLYYYSNINFEISLWKLTGEPNQLPSAADNSVSTLKDTPYMFDKEDFNFVDLNAEDTLVAIQILQIPALKGILHLNGANLNNNDIIPVNDIKYLTYVPFGGELGTPWDSFEFRVFDGEDWSDETYTMLINVVEVLSSQDPQLAQAIQVFPNPTAGAFLLKLDNYTASQDLQVSLVDGLGRLIQSQVRATQPFENTFSFDLSNQPSGIYHLLVRDGAKVAVQKVVLR